MYPTDDILIARGKYSTLSKERREQIERVQTIAKTIMHNANPLLADCQEKPPADTAPLKTLEACIQNATKARDRITELCGLMAELEPLAWGKE
jgi:hypothetical protein